MAGLDSLPDAPTVARIVMAATGESPSDLRIVGQGVTAVGWRADTEGGTYCVLAAAPPESYQDEYPDTGPQFEARAAVLSALHARDARCPRPVATNRTPDIPASLASTRWMVTSWVEGGPASTPVSDEVARDLGQLVAALHALPAEGFGLLVDTADEIRGRESDPVTGLLSRWGEAFWPYDGRPLMAHPLVRVAPHLVPAVGELREQLLAYAQASAAAVCHTDLYGSHLLLRQGRLAGLLDFGDCAIAPPAFDVASFAFYEGWGKAERFLEGYTSNTVLRDIRRAEAYQLGVVLGVQKVHKNTTRRPDERRRRHAVEFIEATLPLAARRVDA